MRADPGRLRQVFWNLIQNAVKFTPNGGKVSVTAENHEEGRIRVAVTDTGIGIAPQHLPRIFNPFEQVSPFSRRAGGLGLGLSISKALVDAFHGTLKAESTGTGEGATFSVELPLFEATKAIVETETRAPAPDREHGKLRILLVEDDDDTRVVLTELLEASDYEVRPARNIAEALQEGCEHAFDLVISNLGLPDGSGLDMFTRLRAMRHVQGIALSGFGMDEDVRRSRSAGFSAHMTKPVTLQALRRTIEEVTRRGAGDEASESAVTWRRVAPG